jgi:hypothetical protein
MLAGSGVLSVIGTSPAISRKPDRDHSFDPDGGLRQLHLATDDGVTRHLFVVGIFARHAHVLDCACEVFEFALPSVEKSESAVHRWLSWHYKIAESTMNRRRTALTTETIICRSLSKKKGSIRIA